MNKFEAMLLGGTALVGAGLMQIPEARAQTAALPGGVVAIQQSAARADAAAFNNSPTSTNCTATQTTVALLTQTITPPAGNFVYLSSITAQQGVLTGTNSVAALSSTNLTGSPAWLLDTNTGTTTIGAEVINQVFPTGLKSSAPGTAVTLVPTATLSSTYVCIQVSGWYSPI